MNPLWSTPWVVGGAVAVAIVAIVSITKYLRKTHQAALDAYLKQDMLNRGMSAEDIKTVLEATGDTEVISQAQSRRQGVHAGLGKLRVELGDLRKAASTLPESPALDA